MYDNWVRVNRGARDEREQDHIHRDADA